VRDAIVLNDFPAGFDPQQRTVFGRLADLWKTFFSDESGAISLSIRDPVLSSPIAPGETVASQGAKLLNEKLC
jgi:hypothetical protein